MKSLILIENIRNKRRRRRSRRKSI